MNIVREDSENRSALLKVTVSEGDYAESVDKILKDYRRKANIPGFRQGKVPMGMIKKMYLHGVTAEETYKIASKAAFDYIDEQKIEYVGDVIPSEKQGTLDFENDTEHEFVFEIGFAPKLDIEFDAKDKITRYIIKPDQEMYDTYRTNFLRKFGKLEDVEVVREDEALTGTLDNELMNIEDAYVGLISMSDEERKPFIGKKVGDKMEVDINELYTNERQRAAMLKLKPEELANIDPKFTFTIEQVRQFVEPKMDEEFFAMAFPDATVSDEAEFEEFIKKQVEADMEREADYIYAIELRNLLLEKANPQMPEEFLRRWLFVANEEKYTQEQIDADFPEFIEMMKWGQVQKYFVEKLEIKIEEQDALAEAKEYARMQFAQYGMNQVGDEMLQNYAGQILSNQEEARQIYDRLFEKKVTEAVTPLLKVVEKEIGVEQFTKLGQEIVNARRTKIEEGKKSVEAKKAEA